MHLRSYFGWFSSVVGRLSCPLRSPLGASLRAILPSVSLVLSLLQASAQARHIPAIDLQQTEALTQQIVALNTQYQQAPISQRTGLLSQLQVVAAERQQLLASLIENDPGAVLRSP